MRDCSCVSWSQVREKDGAAGAEGKVLVPVLEMSTAGRGVCVDGAPGKGEAAVLGDGRKAQRCRHTREVVLLGGTLGARHGHDEMDFAMEAMPAGLSRCALGSLQDAEA